MGVVAEPQRGLDGSPALSAISAKTLRCSNHRLWIESQDATIRLPKRMRLQQKDKIGMEGLHVDMQAMRKAAENPSIECPVDTNTILDFRYRPETMI
ncbi:MAG: hypothetical protein FD150_871 [Rhodobacteraceae bacterium]|nr:MAG: hypothetical protein FD150_871 [Paracoccaceae bacterium]